MTTHFEIGACSLLSALLKE